MNIAHRIRKNTQSYIKYRKLFYKQLKRDKQAECNKFLDKMNKGGMKAIWDYFNYYKKKKKRSHTQLEPLVAAEFIAYWQ